MSILLEKTKESSSFSSVSTFTTKKQERKRSHSAPLQKRQLPQSKLFPTCLWFHQKRLKEFQEELLSDSYYSSQRTTETSRNSLKSNHLISSQTSSYKINHSSYSTYLSGPTSYISSLNSPQLSYFENEESEMFLHNIKEETESETNSMISSFKLDHEGFSTTLKPQIQDKLRILGSILFNKSPDQKIQMQLKNSPFKKINQKLHHYSGEIKRVDDQIVQSKSDKELAIVEATQKSYQKLKAQISLASEKLLSRKLFCQKIPILDINKDNTNGLNDSNCKTNTDSAVHNQIKCNIILSATSAKPNQYVTPFDNKIFHIFCSPQTSLTESLGSINASSLLTQDILYKKVYGFLDRFKKKIVSLYPDRLCYQESKSSPLSTISFSHFDVQINKESFSNVFTLSIEKLKKKYSFRCSDEEQKQQWIAAIADVIILNSNRVKFNLNPKYALVYSKKQVCSLSESQASLKTGDLIIYQLENHGVKSIFHLGMVIKTSQFLLQVCYYSQIEGIQTHSLDDFLLLHDVANLSFRSLRIKNMSLIQEDQLIKDCTQFISKNKHHKKFKDANIFIHDIYCDIGILQPNSSPNIFKFKETIKTAHLNLHTTKDCSFSEEIYVLLPQHMLGADNNNHYNPVQFYHNAGQDNNQVINNHFCQQNLIQYSENLESQIKDQECLLRHQSLIPILSRDSSLQFDHQHQEQMNISPELHSSFGEYWEHPHTLQLQKRSLFY